MSVLRSIAARVVLVTAVTCVAGPEALAQTKRVLVLDSFGRDVESHGAFSRWFRMELAAAAADPVEFYELSLAVALLDEGETEPAFVAYLQAFHDRDPFDLVVTIGGPAARFVQRHRQRVFATTPTLIGCTDVRHVKEDALTGWDAVVPARVDPRGAIENILRLLPETREILLVLGVSPLEAFWVEEFRKEARPFADRVRLTPLNALPLSRIVERAASAREGTVVLFGIMVLDADGVPHGEGRSLAAIREASGVPVFGVWEFHLGKGIVGGPLIPIESLAKQTAGVAVKILDGTPPSSFRAEPTGHLVAFDARELSHWDIPRSRLPAGSEIRFDEPTFWALYRGRILAVVALCLGQGALILWLLASRSSVRRAEAEIRDVSRRLISAQEDERARLARELHDDVTQQLARLAIDAGRLELSGAFAAGSDAETIRDLRGGLVRLSENVHVLSYALHPSLLDDLGLEEAIRAECDRVASRWAVPVELVARDLPSSTPSEAARCLFRVAQEALRNVVRHAGARTVRVRLQGERRGVRLTVRDDGAGFDPAAQRNRPTLGLASMRERVRMAGGSFALHSVPGRGTSVDAWVPLQEPPS